MKSLNNISAAGLIKNETLENELNKLKNK